MWQTISRAPFEVELELAVIDRDGVHSLVFPCRRTPHGWIDAASGLPVDVRPTHWRPWAGASAEPPGGAVRH